MSDSTPRSCPNPDVLRRLCAGDLSPEEETAIGEHLDECEPCQRSLDDLGGGDLSMFSMPPAHQHDSAALRSKLKQLKQELQACSSHRQPAFTDLEPWLEPGDGIGRIQDFELLECLGRGGMGIVFRARDTSLDRTVAIKFLSPSLLADEAAPKRFLREARSAAGINHSHVVTLHRVAQIRELPYLVMEYVHGESLQQRLDRVGKLPLQSIIAVAKQTAEALAAAHDSGVIHRDVKPANILLEAAADKVKLTDFGLARATNGSSLTQSGQLLGTPEFIAPEQVQGASVDHRADLFSLGSVMYTMCTGQVPFGGPSIMATMHQVCTSNTKPASQLNPNIPAWIAELIDKLHAKQPSQRPSDAHSVAELLSRGETASSLNTISDVEPPPITRPIKRSSPHAAARRAQLTNRIAFACLGVFVIAALAVSIDTGRNDGEPHADERRQTASAKREAVSQANERATAENADELLELLEDDDRAAEIHLTSREPYYLPPIEVEQRDMRLIGATGISPVLYLESQPGEPGLTVIDSDLHIEGVTIRADMVVGDDDDLEAQADEDDEDVEHETLVFCKRASLTAVNCRLTSGTSAGCLHLDESVCSLLNSEVVAGEADTILWSPRENDSLTATNCVLIGETNIAIDEADGGELILRNSTAFGATNIEVVTGDDSIRPISIQASANRFDAAECMLLVIQDDNDHMPLSWQGERNRFPATITLTATGDGGELERIESVSEWQSTCHAQERDSEIRLPPYRHSRRQLLVRLRQNRLRAEDLQLDADESNTPSIGADLFFVGPERL